MTIIHKTVAERDGMDFVLSDETVDRYGDIIEAKGWILANFKKNPIALFGHSSSFPIGNWTNVRVEGTKLIGTLVLAAKGTSDRIDELINLVQQGVLRAVSVGFRPIENEPLDPKQPYGGQRYTKQELLETSLVSVPANPAALAVAKSLNVSDETLVLAFGEHADVMRRDLTTTGKHAATNSEDQTRSRADRRSTSREPTMKTLSQRIEDAQNDLTAKRDKLAELTGAETLDNEAIAELTAQIDAVEKTLTTLKAAEAKIGTAARTETGTVVPAQVRKPLGHTEKDGYELLVRAMVAKGIAYCEQMPIEKAIEQRYPGHESLGVMLKAAQTVGSTTGSHWADDLVQTAYYGFLNALMPFSVFPALAARGLSLTFDRWGSLSLPRRTAGTAGGGFVAEGGAIKVGKVTTAAATLTPRKMGIIVAFTKELAKRSTPAIEAVVRQAILEDTAAALDPLLLDATASGSSRPAGLLNGVSAVGTGFAGGDYVAVRKDFAALLAPFYSASAADGIVVLMNPAQGLAMSLMEGPSGDPNWLQRIKDRVTIIESTNVPANRLIAVRAADFVSAGGNPEFDVSEQATIHMEDASPADIVSGGTAASGAVKSLWQTASIGVRMLMDISWVMRRPSVVQWVDTTTY